MTIGEHIKLAIVTAGLIGVPALIAAGVIRSVLRARRDKRDLRNRVRDAIAQITADGKIEGPKGRYRPYRWAPKWLRYSYGLKMPKSARQIGAPELPRYPHIGEH